uniref:Leber congenital amaurosis 5 n=1 Tax=Nothobranchius furzeri TaxID=105023 RepID=A0A1A8AEF4_NOTFU
MDAGKKDDPIEDNRDLSRHSHRSTREESRTSFVRKHKRNSQDKDHKNEGGVRSRSKTRTWGSDPDRDRMSDGEGRSDGSFYSDDYENVTPSERSLSPFPRSRTPSPTSKRGLRAKPMSRNSFHKTAGGAWRRGVSRPQRPGGLAQQHHRGPRSHSKDSTPPKDLDLVTKKMLSARLLKINELRNALAEMQQRTDELQKENRILKQLQVRQEKALRHYDDTESEISQLLSRHSNEIHVLRERLRRTQERERAAERRSKDTQEQLQRSHVTITRLKKLIDQRELGARDELSRKLEEEKTRAQEAERKIKELERSIEVSNSSHQRQLVSERKKTIGALEEIKNLQEETERLTSKLKEKERELDARNIYANRMMKPSLRREADGGTRQKGPSRNSTKAVQTEDRASSLDFPTPPPGISEAHELSEQAPNEYLSLKVIRSAFHHQPLSHPPPDALSVVKLSPQHLDRVRPQVEVQKSVDEVRKKKDVEKELVKQREQKQRLGPDLNVLNEKAIRPSDGLEKEEEVGRKTSSLFNQTQEENYWKRGHVQEEVMRWNQESLSNQQAAQEACQKKETRETDRLNNGPLSESTRIPGDFHPPEQKNRNTLMELEEKGGVPVGIRDRRRRPGVDSGSVTAGIGRRVLQSQTSSDELAFGGYAPSFGHSTSRASSGFPAPPPKEDGDAGLFYFSGAEKEKKVERDKKASLLQQLFGAQAMLTDDDLRTCNRMEVLNSPPAPSGERSRWDGLLSFSSGSSVPPASSINTLQVAESRPAVRAITSFDDDIEELAL